MQIVYVLIFFSSSHTSTSSTFCILLHPQTQMLHGYAYLAAKIANVNLSVVRQFLDGPNLSPCTNEFDCTMMPQAPVGDVLRYTVPDDTFHDPEDGNTANLHLLFQTFEDDLSVAPDSWIQLNQTSRTLYGLPLDDDVGRHWYKLVAVDSHGRLANMTFQVHVPPNPLQQKLSHEFTVRLDIDYQPFLYKVAQSQLSTLLHVFYYTCI